MMSRRSYPLFSCLQTQTVSGKAHPGLPHSRDHPRSHPHTRPTGSPRSRMEGYETIRKLGQGTYGSVFLCRQKATGRQCVMKKLQLTSLDERERRSALQEASLLRQLDHPNVVAYCDMHETRTKLFIFMQYCDGGDLERRLGTAKKERRHIPESQVLDWFVQMSLALQYLHSRRVLHRDLKTANVFLTRANIVKLGDLGVARVLSATTELAKTFVGTPYYLSPELLTSQPYGPPTDIWALGVIFYEIATLEHPFDAKNFPMLANKILSTEPEPISKRRPRAAGGDMGGMDLLFTSMLRKEPDRRGSLAQLLSAPIVQRRMLAFVREIDPTAPCNVAPSTQLPASKAVGKARPAKSPPRPQRDPATGRYVAAGSMSQPPQTQTQLRQQQPRQQQEKYASPSNLPQYKVRGGSPAALSPSRARIAQGSDSTVRPADIASGSRSDHHSHSALCGLEHSATQGQVLGPPPRSQSPILEMGPPPAAERTVAQPQQPQPTAAYLAAPLTNASQRMSPRKKGRRRLGGVGSSSGSNSGALGGARLATSPAAADTDPLARSNEIVQAIEREQERLQTALSQLQAAQELVETTRVGAPPSMDKDHGMAHDMPSDGPRDAAGRYEHGGSIAPDACANNTGADESKHFHSFGERHSSDSLGGGAEPYAGPYADPYSEAQPEHYDEGYAEQHVAHNVVQDRGYGCMPQEQGAQPYEPSYDNNYGSNYEQQPCHGSVYSEAYALTGNAEISGGPPPSTGYPLFADGLGGGAMVGPSNGMAPISTQEHVAAAIEAASAAAAAAIACSVPWSEPAPFQSPAPWKEADEGAGYSPQEQLEAVVEATAEEEAADSREAVQTVANDVHTTTLASGGVHETAAATDGPDSEFDLGNALHVPSTFRLLPMAGYRGPREEMHVLSAADLPSPTTSPPSRNGGHATQGSRNASPRDRYNRSFGADGWEMSGADGEERPAAEMGATTRASSAAAEAGGDDSGGGEEEYYDDDFETDESLSDEEDGMDGETASEDALQMTLPSADPSAAGASLGNLAELEAELKQLQMQNDEQAVVQDEVHTLSGTLRAVAASLMR